MRNVTVRQLQIFVEAADSTSFARVADKLRLTPSAVSFQIRQIEGQAGFALFERIGKRVRLTEAGAVLLDYARVVLRALREADEAMAALKGSGGGRVTLGLVSTAKYVIPHMVARFQAEAPGVTVMLREGNRRDVLDLLTGGAIDLAVMGQPPPEADVVAARFAPHPSVIVAAPGHRLAGVSGVAPAELAEEPFIMREEGSGTRALSDAFFRRVGFPPRIVLQSSSNEMIKQAVIAGMGLALISRHTVGLEVSLGLLVPLDVDDFRLMRSWFVVHRRTLPLLPLQARLRRFLLERGAATIDDLVAFQAEVMRTARCPSL